eukprot:CAMPEP_0178401034 /NCGR_PEP_ID=MMETSP0689_2-20121128/16093_1 /TAXON_ID=160604 /ORGANISM="Amphidinium massartii, Strain CS-259" /LENGTH=52 /DNA_ID=CAMNT_0020021841 /DNA_START=87 /DNA_END=241 /DNA_ORIENTATION=+
MTATVAAAGGALLLVSSGTGFVSSSPAMRGSHQAAGASAAQPNTKKAEGSSS